MAKQVLSTLFGRTVLIVEKSPQVRETIAGAFQNFRCHVLLASNDTDAFNLLHTHPEIDFVIIEVGNPISAGFPFLEKLRAFDDQRPPVFFIADKRDGHFDEAFFMGAEAIFLQPIHFDELVKGVAFSYEMLMDHAERQHKRRRMRRAKIQFSNQSTGLSSNGYVMNLSKGGMYICSMYNHPAANQIIEFKMAYESEPPIEITGLATVRWLRLLSEYGRPPGFGVEFKNLDEKAQESINRLIAQV
jgi:DNA-binding response OmpR family regulator